MRSYKAESGDTLKYCCSCKVHFAAIGPSGLASFFSIDKYRADGLSNNCRPCAKKTDSKRSRGSVWRRINHPEKYRARYALNNALASGRVLKAQCICGSDKTQAHHHDYSKPLAVVWLCQKCHTKEHAI